MTTSMHPPRTYQATLRVAARGYWFTAGGQKGSFGYFPHLRDRRGLPVYPDSQVLGDLKMAAHWLAAINHDTCLVDSVFGRGGGDEYGQTSRPSAISAGDLRLDAEGRKNWHSDRFEVKSRIQIDDETRTVSRHFLVALELARLDGCTLEAPLYLTIAPDRLDATAALLGEAARLLSGFGAFRSRGYGRGEVTISAFTELRPDSCSNVTCHDLLGTRRHFALSALTHVRSMPVDPGHAQVVPTCTSLRPEQLKGWLAKTYHDHFDHWPTPVQMGGIEISTLHPAPEPGILAWPPPMTTLTDSGGKTRDTWGQTLAEIEQQENFFAGKVRPLQHHSVTEDGRIWPYAIETRMRNALDEKFVTGENSLFAQEFLPSGTVFTGSIAFASGIDAEFAARILTLLTGALPTINSALFMPAIGPVCNRYGRTADLPELLADSRGYSPELHRGNNRIVMTTVRGYNISCRRPRRGRIMIAPGSVLLEDGQPGNAAWKGFKATALKTAVKIDYSETSGQEKREKHAYGYPLKPKQKELSKAQAGQLRLLCHPALTAEAIHKMLSHRLDKYRATGRVEALCELLGHLLETLTTDGLEKMRQSTGEIVEQLALARWEKKAKQAQNENKEA